VQVKNETVTRKYNTKCLKHKPGANLKIQNYRVACNWYIKFLKHKTGAHFHKPNTK